MDNAQWLRERGSNPQYEKAASEIEELRAEVGKLRAIKADLEEGERWRKRAEQELRVEVERLKQNQAEVARHIATARTELDVALAILAGGGDR